MKLAIRLLLISALGIGPVSCNRNNATDETVSANADRTAGSDQTQPNTPPKQRTEPQKQQTVRENRPAARAPEKQAARPVQPPTDNNRAVETTRARRTEAVPAGTAFTVTLADTINTDANKEGDMFTAHLSQPILVDGSVVADKGDRVTGHIVKLEEPGKVEGRARLELVLDEIRTSRDTYKLSTEPFIVVAEDSHKRDAAEIGGGAAVGAAIGAIAGGKKGAAIGAVIGGGTGTTAVLLTKGKQLKLEPETKVNFVLKRDVTLPVIRSSNT
jgi:hypothetical protein